MAHEPSFGEISERSGDRPPAPKHFRVAMLGDFSGRANRGDDTPIGKRKPVKVDYDTLEDVFRSMEVTIRIPVGGGASAVDIAFEEIEDFHPDRLFGKVELIDEVLGLTRRLDRAFDKAAPLILGWGKKAGAPCVPPVAEGGAFVPCADGLADLAGREPAPTVAEGGEGLDGNDLLARLVGPYVKDLAAAEPDAATLKAAIAAAGDGLLREILHHPDFRAVESAWRGLDWFLRRVAKGDRTRVVLLDVAASELAADLASVDSLDDSGVFELLVKKTAEGVDGDPWCAIVGLYTFDLRAVHADLLGRMGRLGHRLHAPFLTGVAPRLLVEKAKLDDDDAPAWDALRALPESRYVGLAGPGFLLRRPYGEDGDETEELRFEELPSGGHVDGYLWGNAALAAAALLAQDFTEKRGWGFHPGKSLRLGGMKMHTYRDADGDGVAVMVEKRVPSAVAEAFGAFGPMTLFAERGTDVVQLGRFQSLCAKDGALLGPWGADGGSAPPLFDAADGPGVAVGIGSGRASADDADDADDSDDYGGGAGDDGDDDASDDTSFGDDDGGDDDLSSLLDDAEDDSDDDLASLLGDDSDDSSDEDSGGDDDLDLDALLADDGDTSVDDELAALLSDGDDDDIDDELAKLLED